MNAGSITMGIWTKGAGNTAYIPHNMTVLNDIHNLESTGSIEELKRKILVQLSLPSTSEVGLVYRTLGASHQPPVYAPLKKIMDTMFAPRLPLIVTEQNQSNGATGSKLRTAINACVAGFWKLLAALYCLLCLLLRLPWKLKLLLFALCFSTAWYVTTGGSKTRHQAFDYNVLDTGFDTGFSTITTSFNGTRILDILEGSADSITIFQRDLLEPRSPSIIRGTGVIHHQEKCNAAVFGDIRSILRTQSYEWLCHHTATRASLKDLLDYASNSNFDAHSRFNILLADLAVFDKNWDTWRWAPSWLARDKRQQIHLAKAKRLKQFYTKLNTTYSALEVAVRETTGNFTALAAHSAHFSSNLDDLAIQSKRAYNRIKTRQRQRGGSRKKKDSPALLGEKSQARVIYNSRECVSLIIAVLEPAGEPLALLERDVSKFAAMVAWQLRDVERLVEELERDGDEMEVEMDGALPLENLRGVMAKLQELGVF